MTTFLKGQQASVIWLVLRVYVGYQWMMGGWGKLTGEKTFSAAGFLKGAIAKSVPATEGAKPLVQGWWANFLESFALPNVKLFSAMVAYGELLVGLALIFGFVTIFAAVMGMVMNFSFLLSGTISSNPNYLILQFIIVAVGGAYAGYIGLDYWVRPLYRSYLARIFGTSGASARSTA